MPRVRLDTGDNDGPATGTERQSGVRIDTDVISLLSDARMTGPSDRRETIDRWLDCWSGSRKD